jgi:phosphoglycerol transferase
MVYFSSDNLVNSLILNSSYSVLVDLYNLGGEKSAQDLYGSMPENEIIQQVRESTSSNPADFVSDITPTLAYHPATNQGPRKNIVIILQESLGTRHVGGLGGLPLTPNIDQLIREGWNLANLYATGTRSVRGIEAITTGFSPSPSRSVVKLSKSQHDFFSIASFLQEQGYYTQFIYGGESHFDNMKSFFLGNGFVDIRDLATFAQPKFVGSWGASDEDLFNQADIELTRLSQQKQPFFSLIFTASNHSPYDFPEGCIELYNSPAGTRENAVKYADCALGKFILKAKNASYWKDTIFLVISDHDSRISSASVFPIEHFKIPAIIFGDSIAPRLDLRLSSQLDIPPTLLSLAGVDGSHPMIGHDLSRNIDPEKQRAIMQYGTDYAWMNKDYAIILRANEAPRVYSHDGHTLGQQVPGIDSRIMARARANALWANLAYQKGYYSFSNTAPNNLLAEKPL